MKLTKKNISHIKQTIKIDEIFTIVRIDASDKKDNWTIDETCNNIYCIDKNYNIIWQIKELKTTPPFNGDDPFCYLGKNENNEIIADRFSGFVYKINPETGEATRIGFHK